VDSKARVLIDAGGDMNNQTGNLAQLAKDSDLLVAHNAIPEDTGSVARQLHMPPAEIGEIARQAKIESLLLSHRMNRTLGREAETRAEVGKHYRGTVLFANDLDKFDAHNRDEEKEHAAMVLEWIRRKDPAMDKELKDYLFTEKPIAHK
jgi:hypothetical protein